MDLDKRQFAGQNQPVFSAYRARLIFGVCTAFLILAYLSVALRFLAQKKKGVRYGIDSWILLPALVCYSGEIAIAYVMLFAGGYGHHLWFDSIPQLVIIAKSAIVVQIIYGLAMYFVRTSIIALLIRCFGTLRWFKKTMFFLHFLNFAWIVFVVFSFSLECTPFAYNWDRSIPGGHCNMQQITALIAAGSWTIVMETMIWFLPLVPVWRLQVERGTKLGLTFIFALGLIDIGVSIGRLITVVQITRTFFDFTYASVPAVALGMSEPGISIFLACAAIWRPLFDDIKMPKQFHGLVKWLTFKPSIRGSARSSAFASLFHTPSDSDNVSRSSSEKNKGNRSWGTTSPRSDMDENMDERYRARAPDEELGDMGLTFTPVTDPIVKLMQLARIVDKPPKPYRPPRNPLPPVEQFDAKPLSPIGSRPTSPIHGVWY